MRDNRKVTNILLALTGLLLIHVLSKSFPFRILFKQILYYIKFFEKNQFYFMKKLPFFKKDYTKRKKYDKIEKSAIALFGGHHGRNAKRA
jgi:hypothetical protein